MSQILRLVEVAIFHAHQDALSKRTPQVERDFSWDHLLLGTTADAQPATEPLGNSTSKRSRKKKKHKAEPSNVDEARAERSVHLQGSAEEVAQLPSQHFSRSSETPSADHLATSINDTAQFFDIATPINGSTPHSDDGVDSGEIQFYEEICSQEIRNSFESRVLSPLSPSHVSRID